MAARESDGPATARTVHRPSENVPRDWNDRQDSGATQALQLPHLIAEWPRNKREMIRVQLDAYQDHPTIDVRTWWKNANDEWRPGKSGITVSAKHLPRLADALANALAVAVAAKLIDPETGEPEDSDTSGVSS